MRATRRSLLRAVGTAVVATAAPAASAEGNVPRVAEGSNGSASARQTPCEASADDYPALEGYVFFPRTVEGCTPFRIRKVTRTFRTSVGRGPRVCDRQRREYVAYGIEYVDVELPSGASPDGISTFLAVRTADEDGPPLPHDYFVPSQRFQFVSSSGDFVFHTDCDESQTPVRRVVFATME